MKNTLEKKNESPTTIYRKCMLALSRGDSMSMRLFLQYDRC